jgi:hypothetical protein
VTGTTGRLGGLIGDAANAGIRDCFALGSVTATDPAPVYIAGLVGVSTYSTIINSYAAGKVSTGGSGLVINGGSLTVTSSYFDQDTTGITLTNTYNVGHSTADMVRADTYTDWDFADIWGMDANGSYPYLKDLVKPGESDDGVIIKPEGAGTQASPYLIRTIQEFKYINSELDAYYRIDADLDFKAGFIAPIGTMDAPFIGVLDGNGHTISNFKINAGGSNAGLFGAAIDAQFSQLNVTGGSLYQRTSDNTAGILAGYLDNCTVTDINLIDITIFGGRQVGALAGNAIASRITGIAATGTIRITGTAEIGGLVGRGEDTDFSVLSINSDGAVIGSEAVGSLIGYLVSGSMEDGQATIEIDLRN